MMILCKNCDKPIEPFTRQNPWKGSWIHVDGFIMCHFGDIFWSGTKAEPVATIEGPKTLEETIFETIFEAIPEFADEDYASFKIQAENITKKVMKILRGEKND